MKLAEQTATLLNPIGGNAFDLLHKLRNRQRARQRGQQMHVIGDTTDLDGQAVERLGASTQISLHLGAKRRIVEGGFSPFGGEHRVDQNSGDGLRHVARCGSFGGGRNSVGVAREGDCGGTVTQGSSNPGLKYGRPLAFIKMPTWHMPTSHAHVTCHSLNPSSSSPASHPRCASSCRRLCTCRRW
jgi:hypothetical protein